MFLLFSMVTFMEKSMPNAPSKTSNKNIFQKHFGVLCFVGILSMFALCVG